MNKTTIVIPAYNEAETIGLVLQRTRQLYGKQLHVIVVDDHSSDKTAEIAESYGACVMRLCTNVGAWSAMQAGIRYAVQLGYSQVITMDADGQHEPESIPLLMDAQLGADIVIASFPARGSRLRHIAWHYFRLISGLPVEDLTSGFRLYRKPALDALMSREATLLDYQDIGLLLQLKVKGLKFTEVVVTMNERLCGKSKVFSSWGRVLFYMTTTTLICLAKLFQRPQQKGILPKEL